MIEDVEEFCTKFQGSPFANPGVLMKCKVPIIDPRSMEEAALCVSDAAQGLRREGGGIEEQIPRLSRVEETGRVIDGLGPGIRCQQTESANFLFQGSLQSVVGGIRGCSFPGVVLEIE